MISDKLSIPCSALSGANIALEGEFLSCIINYEGAQSDEIVAKDQFCETTIGTPTAEDSQLWKSVFDSPTFKVSVVDDVMGVSLSGALKNIVALAAGFVDGLGMGGNTKAAILRIGLIEMREFCLEFFKGSKAET